MKSYLKTPLLALLLASLSLASAFADISVTASSVVPGADYNYVDGTAGETLTAGQVVYLKSSDSKYWKAQCDGTAAEVTAIGVALNGASANQPVRIFTSGNLNPGGTVVVGKIYLVSTAAGGIMPVDDLTTTHKVTLLGVGTTASNIAIKIHNTGATVP